MTDEKLVQSPECEDMCEDICEKMYEDMYESHVCPHCSAQLRYDCDIDIETGTLEPLLRCYNCGYTE